MINNSHLDLRNGIQIEPDFELRKCVKETPSFVCLGLIPIRESLKTRRSKRAFVRPKFVLWDRPWHFNFGYRWRYASRKPMGLLCDWATRLNHLSFRGHAYNGPYPRPKSSERIHSPWPALPLASVLECKWCLAQVQAVRAWSVCPRKFFKSQPESVLFLFWLSFSRFPHNRPWRSHYFLKDLGQYQQFYEPRQSLLAGVSLLSHAGHHSNL